MSQDNTLNKNLGSPRQPRGGADWTETRPKQRGLGEPNRDFYKPQPGWGRRDRTWDRGDPQQGWSTHKRGLGGAGNAPPEFQEAGYWGYDAGRGPTPRGEWGYEEQYEWDRPQMGPEWGSPDNRFMGLREALISAPALVLPNSEDKFILDTDASDKAIGAELIQVQGGQEKVVSYGSYALTKEQRKYCTTRKELLAVVRFTRQYRHYLLGRRFTIRTDHSSLTWLLNFREPQGQIARWLEEVSQYDMLVTHRPGKKHVNADALSRRPHEEGCMEYKETVELDLLPCGGCKYCRRAHYNWGSFLEEVDDVIPLALQVSQITEQGQEEAGGPDNSGETPQEGGLLTSRNNLARVGEEQGRDPDFRFLIDWLVSNKTPTEGDLFLASKEAKYYWVNKEIFVMKGSVVFQRDPKRGNFRLLIPEHRRDTVLDLCHKIPLAGHQGIDRTLGIAKSRYYWRGMSGDIRRLVMSCPECSRYKTGGPRGRFELTSYQAGFPMERVHLDFLGPLPKTEGGNTYVLMMVDQFTKWVECVPLPSQSAEVTAKAAVDHFFSRFGAPLQIFTDRGSNFESKLFADMCRLMGIEKTRTTAYRPSANGQVELAPKWKGPGVVMKKLTPYLYKVKLRGSVNTFNHDRIKKCVLKVTPPWVEQAREEATNEGNEGAPHTEVYCICGGPDDGGLMIQCDQCQDWFHGKCVSVNEQQAREIMTYHCPVCEASRVTG